MKNNFGHVILILLVLFGNSVMSQQVSTSLTDYNPEKNSYNKQYIKSYRDKFIPRIYMSHQYTNLTITDELENLELNYEPNSTLNLGVGATVNMVSLNLSYHFKFLNPDNNKGRTRHLDLQSHIYTRKWVVDLYAQFYKGLYLDNTRELAPDFEEEYYVRNDIYQQLLGGSALYLFNNEKFSYRAPFIQNERQLKSAGSFLLGGEATYGIISADSALLPTFQYDIDVSRMDSISRFTFLKIGPSVGYAYSLVIDQRFFATLSFSLNTNYGLASVYHETEGVVSNGQFNVGGMMRWAIGYNDDNWYLGLRSVDAIVITETQDKSMSANFGVGSLRLNFVWRFVPGPKLRKFMDYIP